MRMASASSDAGISISHQSFEVIRGRRSGLISCQSVVSKCHKSILLDDGFGLFQTLFATVLTLLWNYNICTDAVKCRLLVHFLQQFRVRLEIDAINTHMSVFCLGILTILLL